MGKFLWEGRVKGLPCWLSHFSSLLGKCQKKSVIMKSGLDAMPLFPLDDLLIKTFVNLQVTKACFSSFPACLVLIISMILQPIWPRQLSNAQGKRTAYLAASTVPKCMYQNQEAKYMDLIHLVEARGRHEAQQCNEVPNKIKL